MAATTSQIDAFIAILTSKSAGAYAYAYQMGRSNAKVSMVPIHSGVPCESQRSVYCFIRLTDGAILKADSWKAPAKGVRAWLASILADPSPVQPTAGWLYRCA